MPLAGVVTTAQLMEEFTSQNMYFNTFGGNPRKVQVPDVRGQASADAIAALQNRGFKTRTQQKPDSAIPPRGCAAT